MEDMVIADKDFIHDVDSLSPYDLIEKYKTKYRYFTRTDLNYQDGYALIPSDYQEIGRQVYIDSFVKDSGDELTFYYKSADGKYINELLMQANTEGEEFTVIQFMADSLTFQDIAALAAEMTKDSQ